jgi:flagellar biosynthesis regulator FlaF
MEMGDAYIMDNRDGELEAVTRSEESVEAARATAFDSAQEVCKMRNQNEGWTRFVPISYRAMRRRVLV